MRGVGGYPQARRSAAGLLLRLRATLGAELLGGVLVVDAAASDELPAGAGQCLGVVRVDVFLVGSRVAFHARTVPGPTRSNTSGGPLGVCRPAQRAMQSSASVAICG